jgi:hypothetical protein
MWEERLLLFLPIQYFAGKKSTDRHQPSASLLLYSLSLRHYYRFMETNQLGVRVGEVFGTIAWLWVFYRFSQDGKVLLGYEHPWEHGHHGGGDHDHHHGHGHGGHHKKLTADERAASWETFADKAINPGEDDDDDEDEEEDEEDDDEDED